MPKHYHNSPAPHKTAHGDPYKYSGGQKGDGAAPHDTAERDPYDYKPPNADVGVAEEHSHGPGYPVSQPAGGDMVPARLSGSMADGTYDPPGKIGGYAESVPGTKDPAYAVVSGQPAQSWDTGVQGTDEVGRSFGAYTDKPTPRGPTDFSKEDSNKGNP